MTLLYFRPHRSGELLQATVDVDVDAAEVAVAVEEPDAYWYVDVVATETSDVAAAPEPWSPLPYPPEDCSPLEPGEPPPDEPPLGPCGIARTAVVKDKARVSAERNACRILSEV